MATKPEIEQDVRISRFFKADRGLVWRFWTEPDLMALWWGPKGFTAPTVKIDLRVGGKYLLAMRSPEGNVGWNTGTFKEIKELEWFVMTESFADAEGNIVPASYYGLGDDPQLEVIIKVSFTPEKDGTRMVLQYEGSVPLNEGDRKDMIEGWNEQFDKMEAELGKFVASC